MRTRLTVAMLVAAASASLLAQATQPPTSGQQPVFRGGTNLVRVDMYATQNGTAIEDLKPEEVEVLEDGAAQKIESFEFVRVAAPAPQETRREPASVAEMRDMTREARARVFVVFLDTYHASLAGSATMRTPLVRFIDRIVGEDDLIALMTPEMSVNAVTFGRKTTIISNIVNGEWWGRRDRVADEDPREAMYRACYGDDIAQQMRDRRREMLTLDALEGLIVQLRDIREERKAVIAVTEGWLLYRPDGRLARQTDGNPPIGPPVGVQGGRVATAPGANNGSALDRSQCETDRIGLAALDHSRRILELGEQANRGNVSFYPVYARGLTSWDDPAPLSRPDIVTTGGTGRAPTPAEDRANLAARQNAMRELADGTDGTAIINTNQIDAALSRIVADLSSYYLFSYYSTNTRLDGRFREITVRVKRPGVTVRARRGYRGLTAAELTGGPQPLGGATGAAASAFTVNVNPRASLRLRSSGWTVQNGRAAVWIVGELDPATRRDLAWTAGAKADIVVVSSTGTEVLSTTVDVPPADSTFTVSLPVDSAVTPGEYAVRVRVRPNADASLPASDTVRMVVPEAPMPVGEPLLWRRGRTTGPRFVVTADPRFQRSDRIRLELPTAAEGMPAARMLDRLGRPMQVPVQVSTRTDESGLFHWLVAEASLAPLAAGDYAIEVTLGSARQLGAFKIVP